MVAAWSTAVALGALERRLCGGGAGELDQATRILLATDNDEPGQALAEELARRLGRERCWRVRFPSGDPELSPPLSEEPPPGFRKDANDVLLNDGPQALHSLIQRAEPYPIRGLFRYGNSFLAQGVARTL
jgi:twinkle protein